MSEWVGPSDEPDRYELMDLVSRGGEGEVWRASFDLQDHPVSVAVKLLHIGSETDVQGLLTRVREQTDLLRSLDHPGLVKVREWFDGPSPHDRDSASHSGRVVALVMNWAPGQSLPTWVAAHVQRDSLDCTRITTRLAAAVDYLHSGRATGGAPIFHRDIKPANVIVDGADVRLVDFGFARVAGGTATMAGTPAYLAPEVLTGSPPSEAADRFGLGATAYFLFTGLDPDLNDPARMRASLLQASGIEGREDIADHLLAMMNRDPLRRPTNVIEWAQTLAVATVSDRPLERTAVVSSVSAIEGSRRTRRRVLPFAIASVILLIVVAGAGLAFALGGSPSKHGAARPPVATNSTSESSTTTSSSTTSSTADAIPNVVGESLGQAESAIQALGGTVIEDDVLSTAQPDGTVLSQNPASGAPMASGGQVTLQVARQPVGTFLANMQPVSGQAGTGSNNISGKPYAQSVSFGDINGNSAGNVYEAGYDLGRNYEQLTATAGLDDSSDSSAQIQMQIIGDGRTLFSQVVSLGQAVPVKLDVTSVLRLELTVSLVNPNSVQNNSVAAFGNIEVFGTPSQVYGSTTTTTSSNG